MFIIRKVPLLPLISLFFILSKGDPGHKDDKVGDKVMDISHVQRLCFYICEPEHLLLTQSCKEPFLVDSTGFCAQRHWCLTHQIGQKCPILQLIAHQCDSPWQLDVQPLQFQLLNGSLILLELEHNTTH